MKITKYTVLFLTFCFCSLGLFAQTAVNELNFYKKQSQSEDKKLLMTIDRHLGEWIEKNYSLPGADDALLLRADIQVRTRQYPKAYVTLLRHKYEFPNSSNGVQTKSLFNTVIENMPKNERAALKKAYAVKAVPKNTDDRMAQFLASITQLELNNAYNPVNEEYASFFARFPDYENKDKMELMLGDWERTNKNYQASVMQYQKVYDIYPSTKYKAASLRMLGDIYASELKDYDKAAYYYNNVLKNFPSSIEIGTTYHHIAIMNENQKVYTAAVENLTKASEIYLKDAQKEKAYDAFLYKAELQNKKLKDYAGAVDTLNHTAELFKTDQNKFTECKAKAAEIYYSRLKDRYGELAAYESITANYPASEYAPKAAYRSGEIYESLGQTDKAKEVYQKLIINYPADNFATKAQKRIAKIEKAEQKGIKPAAVAAPAAPAVKVQPAAPAPIQTPESTSPEAAKTEESEDLVMEDLQVEETAVDL